MRSLFTPCVALLLVASTLPAQAPTLAERLGYPKDAKLLILHADDLGVAHEEDMASFFALDHGDVSSASVMMPTPWVTEVAAYAKAHPDADIGLHLTLTSEWSTYRWGGVASKDSAPSLVDSTGYFPSDVPPAVAHDKPADVKRELRAQVERALALGIHPTHLDSHMGTLFATPELMAAYVDVAHEYHLPFLALRERPGMPKSPVIRADGVLDTVIMAGPEVPRDHWMQFYLDAIAHLRPGLSEMIVHLGHDGPELQAITVDHEPYGAAWRKRDFETVTSAEFKRALHEHHVILVHWKDLQKLALQP